MCLILVAPSVVFVGYASTVAAQVAGTGNCRGIQDSTARLHCLEQVLPSIPAPPDSYDVNGWKMVKAKDARGGPDAVSITRSADGSRSDLNFAGLMLRCAANNPEAMLVVIEPVPPRAHPTIVLSGDQHQIRLEGSVVPPGVLILLPDEAAALLRGPWQQVTELNITISYDQTSLAGVVSLAGLPAAYQTLVTSCPLPRN